VSCAFFHYAASGDELKIKSTSVLERKPDHLCYEARLLSAMETAGKEIENEEAKAMQNVVLFPATRATIIARNPVLLNYIQRKSKS
jgi:DNA topoisomerase-3